MNVMKVLLQPPKKKPKKNRAPEEETDSKRQDLEPVEEGLKNVES